MLHNCSGLSETYRTLKSLCLLFLPHTVFGYWKVCFGHLWRNNSVLLVGCHCGVCLSVWVWAVVCRHYRLTDSPNSSLGWLCLSLGLTTTLTQWKLQPVSLKNEMAWLCPVDWNVGYWAVGWSSSIVDSAVECQLSSCWSVTASLEIFSLMY